MAYRKRTLRSMLPVTRKLARLIGEQESVARRFKNLIPEISRLELDSRALVNAKQPKSTNKCYRVWFDDCSACLVDALGEIQARCIVETGIANGKYTGHIKSIECLS